MPASTDPATSASGWRRWARDLWNRRPFSPRAERIPSSWILRWKRSLRARNSPSPIGMKRPLASLSEDRAASRSSTSPSSVWTVPPISNQSRAARILSDRRLLFARAVIRIDSPRGHATVASSRIRCSSSSSSKHDAGDSRIHPDPSQLASSNVGHEEVTALKRFSSSPRSLEVLTALPATVAKTALPPFPGRNDGPPSLRGSTRGSTLSPSP